MDNAYRFDGGTIAELIQATASGEAGVRHRGIARTIFGVVRRCFPKVSFQVFFERHTRQCSLSLDVIEDIFRQQRVQDPVTGYWATAFCSW